MSAGMRRFVEQTEFVGTERGVTDVTVKMGTSGGGTSVSVSSITYHLVVYRGPVCQ